MLSPWIVSALVASSCLAAVQAGDLVLKGYALSEVSTDTTRYANGDGEQIHSGNHRHDPCTSYGVGKIYMLSSGRNGDNEGRGFLLVNDCQIVECTKWYTEVNDNTGGRTKVYDLVEDASALTKWNIVEHGQCSCSNGDGAPLSSSCFDGKFLVVDDYSSSDCQVDVSLAGSIACQAEPENVSAVLEEEEEEETDRAEPGHTGILRDWGDKIGLSLAALLVILGLALCCCLGCLGCVCCRRRRRRRNNDKNKEKEKPLPEQSLMDNKRGRMRSSGFGRFASFGRKKVSAQEEEQGDKKKAKDSKKKNKKKSKKDKQSVADIENQAQATDKKSKNAKAASKETSQNGNEEDTDDQPWNLDCCGMYSS